MDEQFTSTPARYAQGKIAVTPLDNREGFFGKGQSASLAEALGGRWSGREGAYIMSRKAVERLRVLLAEGYDACPITGEIYKFYDGEYHYAPKSLTGKRA